MHAPQRAKLSSPPPVGRGRSHPPVRSASGRVALAAALTLLALAAGWWWIRAGSLLEEALLGRAFLVLAILAATSWWRWMR